MSSVDDPATPLRALVGPTAVGKTALALELAERCGAEIVSVDSMLVYRGMDVGTAKPSIDERARVRHHLIDCAEPTERYDARRFAEDTRRALEDLARRGARALFCGGTAFYLRALTHGLFEGPPADLELRARLVERARGEGSAALHAELAVVDPAAARRIHPNDEKRVVRGLEVWEQTGRTLTDWQREWRDEEERETAGRPRRLVGLQLDTEELDLRIRDRTRSMLDAGWIDEVRRLRDAGGLGPTARFALGYRELLEHLEQGGSEEELAERIALRTRQFARRQRTWFRRWPDILWLESAAPGTDAWSANVDRALAHFGW